jgi:hypothetical protein
MASVLRFVTIGGREFAVGLWWQLRHLGPAPKKVVLNLARKTAHEFEKENYNVVSIREQQYGLGHAPDLLPSCFSLAGSVRMRRDADAFLCVFNLAPDLWWVCAITKGIIAAEGDSWYFTRDEAEKAAHSHQQMVSTDFVIYNTPEESFKILEPLLAPDKLLEPLHPCPEKRKRQVKRATIFGAVAALIISVVLFYNAFQERETLRNLRRSLDTKTKYQEELQRNPEKVFPARWNHEPMLTAAGLQCADAIASAHPVSLGWSLDELICAPGASIVVYRTHNSGAAFVDLPPEVRLVTSKKTVESVALPKMQKRAALFYTQLPRREKLNAVFYEVTQALKANLEKLSWAPPEQIIQDDIQLVAPWQAGNFIISAIPHSVIHSGLIFKSLEYPGLVINSVVFNAKSKKWTIQGVAYAGT